MKNVWLEKFAKLIVEYCLDVDKGDLVQINGVPLAAPLVKEVYRETLKAGGHPFVRVGLPGLGPVFYETAGDEQLSYVNPVDIYQVKEIDKVVSIRAPENKKALTNVDPARQQKANRSRKDLREIFMKRAGDGELDWCGTLYPTNALAQDAEMSLDEYEDFVFRACMLHRKNPVSAWKTMRRKQAKICSYLGERKKLRIVREGTDLTLSVEGRKWINSDGRHNMPSGEVFTAPVEDSVNGTIQYSFPAVWGGREVHGVRLTFKDGRVVKASAEKGEDFLLSTLDTDEGSRVLGEVAVGTNQYIQQFTKNILFDEKIGGTVHLAVGAAYPESGGVNTSGIHWDMITDMRDGGKIYADGKLIYKNGEFTKI
ncbi:MAG: aminopeptidase [Candidatus Eisenbacteria bacterium]|nr:aminopeptidase [Candidatus Eisenbacteria bacterium]